MSKNTNIVILGAGYAGVHAAKKLAKKYKKNPNIKITLIDKNPYHTLMTELHEVAGGRVPEESVKVELSKIFHRTKVNVVVDYIEKVDMETQVVETTHGSFTYDYLLMGMGSEQAYFGIPGVKEHGFGLWSLDEALAIREHIIHNFKKASLERDAAVRKELLTFVVAGSGFTGIEMAGELLEWKHTLAEKYHVDVNEVTVTVVEAAGTILNMLDRKQADKAEKYMVKHNVEILKNAPIVGATPESITLKDGRVIKTHTLIWTCGIKGAEDLTKYNLELTPAARAKTNQYMQAEGKENVYIIGDCAYVEEEPGKGNPQIVEAAEQTAVTAVKNIINDIDGKADRVAFKSNYHGFMVSIGGRYAVANLMGMKLSGFFAMAVKHLINMVYLFGVNNIHAVYHYLQHEFFGMKQTRNIMWGHLSSKGNRLWLVPLRLYIGVLWLMEGLKKLVGDGTWDKAVDALWQGKWAFEVGADSWIRSGNVKMPFEWLYTDATSAASAAGDAAGEAVAMVTPILKEVPDFYEAIMKIFMPNADIAVLFQTMVVCLEIGMGLALIAGLFTWLASASSAFMVVNFVLSAMAGWDILWYFFGSIALMCGAGRTFGLDAYVMPWINRMAGNWWMGKNRHIYSNQGGKNTSL
ncbi:MAG: FAD-dependent oxidoreductase [Cellulosilyticaceae bacterium]